MPMDYVSLSGTPCGESCAQVGTDDYYDRMRVESKRYIAGLKRLFPMPEGCAARYVNKSFPHDFGSYHEVCIVFADSDETACRYAYHVENNLPETWEELETAPPKPLPPE